MRRGKKINLSHRGGNQDQGRKRGQHRVLNETSEPNAGKVSDDGGVVSGIYLGKTTKKVG